MMRRLVVLLLLAAPVLAGTPRHGFNYGSSEVTNTNLDRLDTKLAVQKQMREVTTGVCATGGCNVTVTWPSAFADANYLVLCTAFDATAGNETGLVVERVSAVVAASATVKIQNLSAGNITGAVSCLGIHD